MRFMNGWEIEDAVTRSAQQLPTWLRERPRSTD